MKSFLIIVLIIFSIFFFSFSQKSSEQVKLFAFPTSLVGGAIDSGRIKYSINQNYNTYRGLKKEINKYVLIKNL